MVGAYGIPLPARCSLPCSTSGRGAQAPSVSAGRCRASRRHGKVSCRSQSRSNPDFGLGPRFRPLDSIDYEWRALNQDRASAKFSSAQGAGIWLQSDVTMWDMIDFSELSSDTSDKRCSGDTQTPCKDRFWQHGPASNTNYWDDYGRVHVILFGVGEGDPEGIYSVRAVPGADQLPQETIIAFESAEDATRYASRLEATMDRAPSVVPINPSELLDFCQEAGYNCRLEQNGSVLTPPDFNVDITDWERSLRLRNGMWSVVDEITDQADDLPYPYLDSSTAQPFNNAGVYLPNESAMALEELRSRLEKLMQLDG